MVSSTTRKIAIALAAIVIMTTCLIDAGAQKRRRKRRRAPSAPVITNPAITAPSPSPSPDPDAGGGDSQPVGDPNDPDSMRQTIQTLSTQVDRLNNKIDKMEQGQRSSADLERLTLTEQRAQNLRSQLSDVQVREGEVQARLENIDIALQPQNIDRFVGGIGTTHPEEARDQRRKQLESERVRVRAQLDTLMQSQARLEQAIAAADAEVEKIRQRLNAADEAAIQNAKKKGGGATGSPTPNPTPTPYPES